MDINRRSKRVTCVRVVALVVPYSGEVQHLGGDGRYHVEEEVPHCEVPHGIGDVPA